MLVESLSIYLLVPLIQRCPSGWTAHTIIRMNGHSRRFPAERCASGQKLDQERTGIHSGGLVNMRTVVELCEPLPHTKTRGTRLDPLFLTR